MMTPEATVAVLLASLRALVREYVAAEIASLRTRETAPETREPARVKLGAWENVAVDWAERHCGDKETGLRATKDGHWIVFGPTLMVKEGRATLGAFPDLLTAAQHAADTSPEALRLYEWGGRPATKAELYEHIIARAAHIIEPAAPLVSEFAGVEWSNEELDDMAAFANEACVFSSLDTDRANARHSLSIASDDDATQWADYVRQRARTLLAARTPTREQVEAAIAAWRKQPSDDPTALVDWLGWSVDEWLTFDASATNRGTIPARPLREHPPVAAPTFTDGPRPNWCARTDCENPRSQHYGAALHCRAEDCRDTCNEAPTVTDAREVAIKCLLDCRHPSGPRPGEICGGCGGVWVSSKWELPAYVRQLAAAIKQEEKRP